MPRSKTLFPVALCVCLLLVSVLAGCGAKAPASTGGATGGGVGAGPTAGPVTIVMKDLAFSPTDATVKVGDTVTFDNQDSAAHRISIDGQDLGQQTTGQKVEWKPTKVGTFPFSCTIHPAMTGQVTVQ